MKRWALQTNWRNKRKLRIQRGWGKIAFHCLLLKMLKLNSGLDYQKILTNLFIDLFFKDSMFIVVCASKRKQMYNKIFERRETRVLIFNLILIIHTCMHIHLYTCRYLWRERKCMGGCAYVYLCENVNISYVSVSVIFFYSI